MSENPRKVLHLTDLHFGYERKSGHKIPLHDPKAMNVALQFAQDFKPDVLVLGGDILDCGAISHHNRNKPGRIEGLRLLSDAQECTQQFIQPLNSLEIPTKVFIKGNHEFWLDDLAEELPGLEGMFDLPRLLPLEGYQMIDQGGHYNLGKLTYIHGDQLSGGEHVAKNAVISYERSVRFGHHHSYQVYSKNSPITEQQPKTGVSVPCLCRKDPHYGKGKPNKWSQGFGWGYVFKDGNFTDYVSLIINGKTFANGKFYSG